MKSYTDLEQSKKLAEFLPLESADMYWVCENNAESRAYYGERPVGTYLFTTHCWSLAALLSVLPAGKSLIHGENTHKYKLINCLVDAEWHDNPVDACYEIILKLNELKML